MSVLGVAAGIYFLIQGGVFWRLGHTSLRTWLKVSTALAVIFLLPFVMYIGGIYREFGDDGAANTVVSLLAVVGGFLNAFVVFVFRSIRHESALP
jgi:uncharacterized membrane protein YdcZ (DUF606 family)